MNKGYIYIMTNPSFKEYVKIGWAANVEQRKWEGCNEIFMQSQRGLAAENAKDTRLMPRSRPASGL